MHRVGNYFLASLAFSISINVARAELRCDEPTVDLGRVKAGQPVTHRFTLINRGPEAVEITNVQPGCGCLRPQLAERRLRPGDAAVLLIGVNTLTTPAGPNAWRVEVFYTAAGKPSQLTVVLHATVVTEITVRPAALILHTSSCVGHDVTVSDGRPHPLAITSVRTTAPLLQASLREPRRDDDGSLVQTVHVEVSGGFPEGRHDETVQIFTADPEYPVLRVPVTVVKESRAAVSASPAEVTFEGAGPLPARVVLLRGSDGLAVEVASVECSEPCVHCTFAKGPGDMATLRVRVDRARVPPDGLHATLRVHLASPSGGEAVLPVHCALK